eukprot:159209_1
MSKHIPCMIGCMVCGSCIAGCIYVVVVMIVAGSVSSISKISPILLYEFINGSFDETISGHNPKYTLTQGSDSNAYIGNNVLHCNGDNDHLYTKNNLDFNIKSYSLEIKTKIVNHTNWYNIGIISIDSDYVGNNNTCGEFDQHISYQHSKYTSIVYNEYNEHKWYPQSTNSINNNWDLKANGISKAGIHWIHLVFTYNVDNNTVKMYTNGVHIATAIHSPVELTVNKRSEFEAIYESTNSIAIKPIEPGANDCLALIPIVDVMSFGFDLMIHSFCEDDELCVFFHIGNQTNFESQINSRYPLIGLTKYGFYISFSNKQNSNPFIEFDGIYVETAYTFLITITQNTYSIIIDGIEHYNGDYPNHNTINHELSSDLPLYMNSAWYPPANVTLNNMKIDYNPKVTEWSYNPSISTSKRTENAFGAVWESVETAAWEERVYLFGGIVLGIIFAITIIVCFFIGIGVLIKRGYDRLIKAQEMRRLVAEQTIKELQETLKILEWKAKKDKITKFVNNPIVIFFGISLYDFEEQKNDAAVKENYTNYSDIKRWCTKMNYDLYSNDIYHLKLTKPELIAQLKQYAAKADASYDCILFIMRCYGLNNAVITSEYQLLSKISIHRLFSLNYPSLRNVPRIFLFDCYQNNEDNKENDEQKEDVSLEDIKFTSFGRQESIWKRDQQNPDFQLAEIHGVNTRSQESDLITHFMNKINNMNTNFDQETSDFLGDIIDDIQESLGKEGIFITSTFNNKTRNIIFRKNDTMKTMIDAEIKKERDIKSTTITKNNQFEKTDDICYGNDENISFIQLSRLITPHYDKGTLTQTNKE